MPRYVLWLIIAVLAVSWLSAEVYGYKKARHYSHCLAVKGTII